MPCKIPCGVVNMILGQSIDQIRSSQSFTIKSNCVRSDHIRSDQVRLGRISSQIRSDQVGSVRVESDQVKSEHVRSDQVVFDQVRSDWIGIRSGQNRSESCGSDWVVFWANGSCCFKLIFIQ